MFFFFNQKYCSRTQTVNGIHNSQFIIHNYDYYYNPELFERNSYQYVIIMTTQTQTDTNRHKQPLPLAPPP
ncbi:Uncharacterised protein [Prevotella melaninogenica]|nr:Uncharacterised protein [Prevotella melaninogenica]